MARRRADPPDFPWSWVQASFERATAPIGAARGLGPAVSDRSPSPSHSSADEPNPGLAGGSVESTEPPKTVTRRRKTREIPG